MTSFGPTSSLHLPRFCDVPTFMRLPRASDLEGLDVGVLGLPSDNGSPFRTGARFGPNAVRAMSVMLRPINSYHRGDGMAGGIDVFKTLAVADLGDAPVIPGYMVETLDVIENAVAAVVDAGVIPFCIGGDHGVTIAELRALVRRYGPLALVHFDAHSDTWDTYFGGMPHSAGTPFRRAVEERLVDTARSIQIGMRGTLFASNDVSQSLDLGYEVVTTDGLFARPFTALAEDIRARTRGAPVFLSFDMDFVDPSAAPGVQTPEAGGPSQRETLALVRLLTGLDIVGVDVVETNPLYEGPGQITALLAATVAAEVMALIAVEKQRRSGAALTTINNNKDTPNSIE